MAWGVVLSVILGTSAIVGTIIWGVSHNKKTQKIDVPMNAKIVINIPRSKFTEGYYIGSVNSEKDNKNGTTLVTFYPIDVEQGDDVPKPNMQSVVVNKEDISYFGNRRNIMVLSSKDKTDYPKPIRDTLEVDFETKEGIKSFLIGAFGKMIKEKDKAIAEIIPELAGGEITSHAFGKLKEELEKKRKLDILREPEKKE